MRPRSFLNVFSLWNGGLKAQCTKMSFVGGYDCWKDHSTCRANKEQKANRFLHWQCPKKKLNYPDYPFDWMVLKHNSRGMLIHMGNHGNTMTFPYWLDPMPHRNRRRGSKGLMLGSMTWKSKKKYHNFGPLKCSFCFWGKHGKSNTTAKWVISFAK